MLPREKRLSKGQDFDRVYQRGKRAGSDSFNLITLPNRLQMSRVGIVVGKKFSKKATERNRAKRIYREAISGIYKEIKPGLDVIVFVKKTDKKVSLEAVRAELKKALTREEQK